jgi:hypothetical protein
MCLTPRGKQPAICSSPIINTPTVVKTETKTETKAKMKVKEEENDEVAIPKTRQLESISIPIRDTNSRNRKTPKITNTTPHNNNNTKGKRSSRRMSVDQPQQPVDITPCILVTGLKRKERVSISEIILNSCYLCLIVYLSM